jgi:hypothetical protein
MSYYKIENLEQYLNTIINLFVNLENFGEKLQKKFYLYQQSC